jgi:citrate lyase subunit beta/citryl-CoA lyase
MTTRSYLYVPGSAGRRLYRAADKGADSLIVDLEDGVAPAHKDSARSAAADFLRHVAVPTWVRVNSGDRGLADAEAVANYALTGIVVPKAESADQLHTIDRVLSGAEARAGLPLGSIALSPLVESAVGLQALDALARAPRVRMLQIGEVDLAADLGLDPSPGGTELAGIRSSVVVAGRAARLEPPVAAVSVDFTDLDSFRSETDGLRRAGFFGRACIHPAQIPVVHEVFTPSPEQLDQARSVMAAMREALARGDGTATDASGRLIDEAVVRSARRMMDAARRHTPV